MFHSWLVRSSSILLCSHDVTSAFPISSNFWLTCELALQTFFKSFPIIFHVIIPLHPPLSDLVFCSCYSALSMCIQVLNFIVEQQAACLTPECFYHIVDDLQPLAVLSVWFRSHKANTQLYCNLLLLLVHLDKDRGAEEGVEL